METRIDMGFFQKLVNDQRDVGFDLVERRTLTIWTKGSTPDTAQMLLDIQASGQVQWHPERSDDCAWKNCKFRQVRSCMSGCVSVCVCVCVCVCLCLPENMSSCV